MFLVEKYLNCICQVPRLDLLLLDWHTVIFSSFPARSFTNTFLCSRLPLEELWGIVIAGGVSEKCYYHLADIYCAVSLLALLLNLAHYPMNCRAVLRIRMILLRLHLTGQSK